MSKNRSKNFVEALKSLPPWLRKSIGILLIFLGFLGFLPIIGFWMIPLGLIVLSVDYRLARSLHVRCRLMIRNFKKYRKRKRNARHQHS